MMGSETPKMDRGPFLGPDASTMEDMGTISPNMDTVIPSIVSFFDNEVSLDDNDSFVVTNYNQSFEETRMILGYETHPSEYSWPEIVTIAIIITIIMIVIVVGNMLVIIAIATEKSLKNITNWFIASLAVADLLLGLIIMPFSLAYLLMGYWIFGDFWCELHSAIDVLLSTASINNICLISLDRYWSITHAVAYLKKRTPQRSAVMIVVVWVFSGLVSIPPLLGWKKGSAPETFPKCEVSEDLGYVIYSSLGSFWIPSAIMIFVYIRIYYAAKARANKSIPKDRYRKNMKKDTTCTTPEPCTSMEATPKLNKRTHLKAGTSAHSGDMSKMQRGLQKEHLALINKKVQIYEEKTREGDDNREALLSDQELCTPLKTLSAKVDADHKNHNFQDENGLYLRGLEMAQENSTPSGLSPGISPTKDSSGSGLSPPTTLKKGHSAISVDGDQMSDMEPSSSDSGAMTRCSVMKPLKMRFCHPFIGKKINKPKREIIDMGRVRQTNALRDPDKEKRRMARKKEKRATFILGLIMGSFIACWLPFFVMYILGSVTSIPPIAFRIAFWLGYTNSALNPVIYTIFNRDFRRAFRKILFK